MDTANAALKSNSREHVRRRARSLSKENRCLKGVVAGLKRRIRDERSAVLDGVQQLSILKEANQNLVRATFSAADLQQAAEFANERQTVFLSMLAHELRNPIASIKVATEMIRTLNVQSVKHDKLLSIVERQSFSMVRLVDDLLDVSRLRTGKLALQLEDTALVDVLESAISTARAVSSMRKQQIHLTLPDIPIMLWGDQMRLVQLFTNLLVNASKFSPSGTMIRVTASLSHGAVAIRVRDQGVGIAEQDIERIFGLFEQVPNEAGRALSGGLGIGLLLVRAIAQLHGGTVSVASEGPGQGSEFTVTLPLTTGSVSPALNKITMPESTA